MIETREHVVSWINNLIKEIQKIDVDSEDYDYTQSMEAVMKLELYLVKLESGDYASIQESV